MLVRERLANTPSEITAAASHHHRELGARAEVDREGQQGHHRRTERDGVLGGSVGFERASARFLLGNRNDVEEGQHVGQLVEHVPARPGLDEHEERDDRAAPHEHRQDPIDLPAPPHDADDEVEEEDEVSRKLRSFTTSSETPLTRPGFRATEAMTETTMAAIGAS